MAMTIRENHLDRTVMHLIGWSSECIKLLDLDKFNTVFIDGGHDYDSCRSDFLSLMEKKVRPMRLMFHDYQTFEGVTKTIEDHVKKEPGFSFVAQIDSIFICDLR